MSLYILFKYCLHHRIRMRGFNTNLTLGVSQ